jgi:hypothetical protein
VFECAAKLSGAMFALLRGDGARLHRALIQFALSINSERNEEIIPPHFVRPDMMMGTGTLPKFEADAYRFRDDDLWAIPTGEVPLTNLHAGEILTVDELPKRYMAYTVCFRREAGSAGKDTRGMQRLHEFHKVELVRLCTPEMVKDEFELLVSDAERPLKMLGLPYRVLDLCGGDVTFSSTRVHDLEVYSPGTKSWLEVSSVGILSRENRLQGHELALMKRLHLHRKDPKHGREVPASLKDVQHHSPITQTHPLPFPGCIDGQVRPYETHVISAFLLYLYLQTQLRDENKLYKPYNVWEARQQ